MEHVLRSVLADSSREQALTTYPSDLVLVVVPVEEFQLRVNRLILKLLLRSLASFIDSPRLCNIVNHDDRLCVLCAIINLRSVCLPALLEFFNGLLFNDFLILINIAVVVNWVNLVLLSSLRFSIDFVKAFSWILPLMIDLLVSSGLFV